MPRKKSRPTSSTVVGYLRTSTSEQDLGLDAQRAGIERWAVQHGLTVASWHEDQLSGTTPLAQRPGLTEALASLRATQARALVVLRRCRLGRDPRVIMEIEAAAHVLDTEAAPTVSADDESEYMRRGMWDLMNAVERKRIARRTREALAVLKKNGRKLGAYPYGYDRQARPVDHEQRALTRMRELDAQGLTLAAIAATLAQEGFQPRGAKWQLSTLSRLLRAS